ncbi:EAL domain-containing protein [Acidisphaera sp. L21]|jgi:EAL domain-containing protein (putative c-di-GMP-specific phosphodiesterase class I)|uniref:EAL domain-containing protein n=1 Tax=Acidisphaera sp. L21 TaxID=1641851 RepID=UPI00131AECCA|nr:EAL domain-containing protein [Acidisphaera sp. L21]
MSAHLAEKPSKPVQSQKDRFLAFAFAAADLLVEATADGTICFAAGAFKARFGAAPEQFTGRHLHRLFAPADKATLDLALYTTALRGRLPPLVLRLSDAAATPMVISGLAMPSSSGRLCFTIGRLPSLPGPVAAMTMGANVPNSFTRLAEERLRSEDGGAVSLLEVEGWSTARESLPVDAQRTLQTEIVEVLGRLGGPGSIAGEISSGRYGILADSAPDLSAVAAELEILLRAHPATARTQVQGTGLGLERNGLTGPQAARALRFALARFADGGTKATSEAGFANGLAEFIASAQLRARTVRTALAENRFRLAFQPVVNLNSRSVHHYEALLRPIFTPGNSIQTTQDFVTFAESVGLSEELDWAVMQQGVAAQVGSSGSSIAVNVSGLSMQSPGFREKVTELLRTSVAPGKILIELTETADIEDIASASSFIDELRSIGTPVCIDDFGAGSAAFKYLKEFRVDYVKLDGAYVRGALQNAREHGFLLSMIELANFVGAKVIAETIEQDDEAKMMTDLGVEYGQGWLFGKPGQLPGT